MAGKRECAVCSTDGMHSSIGLLMSMTYICERGIMMSRADKSETWNAPSIIDSASASIKLRSWASCRTSSSSARFSGSGEISAVRRSNSDRWGLASVLTPLECSCIGGVSRCDEGHRIHQKGGAAGFCQKNQPRFGCCRSAGVGIGDAERGQDVGLQPFHLGRFLVVLVVVALRVQHAVDDQVGGVLLDGFLLLGRLAFEHVGAKDDVGLRRRVVG